MTNQNKEQIRLDFLRILDEKKGSMSDRQVAEKAGLSNSALSQYRTGKSKEPTSALLNALSPVLGYDDEWGLFYDVYSVETKQPVPANMGNDVYVFMDKNGNLLGSSSSEIQENDPDTADINIVLSDEDKAELRRRLIPDKSGTIHEDCATYNGISDTERELLDNFRKLNSHWKDVIRSMIKQSVTGDLDSGNT